MLIPPQKYLDLYRDIDGAGKTWSVARKAVLLSLANPGCDGIITEPNFALLDQILIPELKDALDEFGVNYNYVNGTFNLVIKGHESRIIPKSAENYERLIGVNAAYIIMDEFDTSKPSLAYKAYQKLLGRIRVGKVKQMIIVSTPEGFGAMHKIFVEEDNKDKRLIKASTLDNHHLPVDYIRTMRDQYPPQLIKSYINGEFVNLTQGTVYNYFDRTKHHTNIIDEDIKKIKSLHIGVDFNVGYCSMIFSYMKGDDVYTFREHGAKDTFEVRDILIELSHRYKYDITIYPDASGSNRTSNSSQSNIDILTETTNFTIDAPLANPRIQDRVNVTNNLFSKGHLYIDTKRCPKLSAALERQAYDEQGKPEKSNEPGSVDDLTDSYTYFIHRKLNPGSRVTFETRRFG